MQKKSLLALLLALMLVLSGCSLVTVDQAADNARIIVDVNGETVTKQQISNAVNNAISQNEYMNQIYAMFGMEANYPTDEATLTPEVISSYVENLVKLQKAKALKMDEFTEEDLAHIEEHTQEDWTSYLSQIASAYFPALNLEGDALEAEALKYIEEYGLGTKDDVRDSVKDELLLDKLQEYVYNTVTVSDEEVTALYDEKVAADQQSYTEKADALAAAQAALEEAQAAVAASDTEETQKALTEAQDAVADAEADLKSAAEAYASAVNGGSASYYAPAGNRLVRHILIKLSDEDNAVITEKNTAKTDADTALKDAQTALDEAAEDADKDALQAAVDEAQKAADEAAAAVTEATEAAFANALTKANEVYALATAEGADFSALVKEYSQDTDDEGKQNMPEAGYVIREGYSTFEAFFVEAGMALAQVGDVSEPVRSQYGYHILQYASDVAEGPVALETVRATVENEALTAKQEKTYSEEIEKWTSEATVKTYPEKMN